MKKHTDEELCAIINKRIGYVSLADKLAQIPMDDARGFRKAVGKMKG